MRNTAKPESETSHAPASPLASWPEEIPQKNMVEMKFPWWTVALSVLVFGVWFGHGQTDPGSDPVRVIDKGLFVVGNSYSSNMSIPVVDGEIMNALTAGHLGDYWEVRILDSQPHNFQFEVNIGGSIILENAIIIHSATVYLDLGSFELPGDLQSFVRWI